MTESDCEDIPPTRRQRISESTPLLASDRRNLSSLRQSRDFIARHIAKVHGEGSWIWNFREGLQQFLSSKWGHYLVIFLVAADISGIFADFLVSLHICEHGGEPGFNRELWETANETLDYLSLAFSCLFMVELLASIYAFGFRFFNSKFHIFDATVIVAGFIVDVVLRGPIEEAGSLIVAGRLWRVFKIIEEFSSGAEDQLEELHEKIEHLESEKESIARENEELRRRIESQIQS